MALCDTADSDNAIYMFDSPVLIYQCNQHKTRILSEHYIL